MAPLERLRGLRTIPRVQWLRVGFVMCSQFALFVYLASNFPGALVRGGAFAALGSPLAGPFAVHEFPPFRADSFIGFRCAR
jgi:hypothetical protein